MAPRHGDPNAGSQKLLKLIAQTATQTTATAKLRSAEGSIRPGGSSGVVQLAEKTRGEDRWVRAAEQGGRAVGGVVWGECA